tara:strand:+ start:1390 stop:2226 length:837 start_codon:yes stop_codon:yes gene_type:complete
MVHQIGIMQGRLSKPEDGKIQSFPFKTWSEEFYSASDIGLSLIEWVLDDNINQNPIMQKKFQKDIKELQRDTNVKIDSICCDFFMQNPFLKEQKNFNKINVEILENLISDICPKNHIHVIDLPMIKNSKMNENVIQRSFYELITSFENEIIKNNIKIALETDLNPYEFKDFFSKFNKDYLMVNYDMGNSAYWNFNLKNEFLCYGNKICNVHVKDCTPEKYTVKLGSGDVKFKDVFLNLKKYRYSNNFILQAARSSPNQIDDAFNQIEFLKYHIKTFLE